MSTIGKTGTAPGSTVEAHCKTLDLLSGSVLKETASRKNGLIFLSFTMFVIAALLLALGIWSISHVWPIGSVPDAVKQKVEDLSAFSPAGFLIAGYLCAVYASAVRQFSRTRKTLDDITKWTSQPVEAKIAAETTAIRRIQTTTDYLSKKVMASVFCAIVGMLGGFLAGEFGNGKTATLMALLAGVGLPVGILAFRAFAARQLRQTTPKIREEIKQIEEEQQQLTKELATRAGSRRQRRPRCRAAQNRSEFREAGGFTSTLVRGCWPKDGGSRSKRYRRLHATG
jgi:hypothetical protein